MIFRQMMSLFSILVVCALVNAQSVEFKSFFVHGKHGGMYLFSSDKEAITIKIDADSVVTTDEKGIIVADNMIIQALAIPIDISLSYENQSSKDILFTFMNQELDYNRSIMRISDINSEFSTINDREFLLWTYKMPKKHNSVKKQLYNHTML